MAQRLKMKVLFERYVYTLEMCPVNLLMMCLTRRVK